MFVNTTNNFFIPNKGKNSFLPPKYGFLEKLKKIASHFTPVCPLWNFSE